MLGNCSSRPTPLSVEIGFHSESGICTIVSQPCFTTRNLRTKLCGIRSQTQKQEFVDPFKSWYLETRSDPEMENRLACGKHFSHKDSTKIWNGLYCITWNTILRIPDPESKTISRDSGVGRHVVSSLPEIILVASKLRSLRFHSPRAMPCGRCI